MTTYAPASEHTTSAEWASHLIAELESEDTEMAEHIFDGIIRMPVNITAARVTTQSKNTQEDVDLTPHQVQERVFYLTEHRKKIGIKIGIVAKTQHRNIMYKANRYPDFVKKHPQSLLLAEWVRIGKEMNRLTVYLAEKKDSPTRISARI